MINMRFLIDGHYFETTVKTTLQGKASELALLKKKGIIMIQLKLDACMGCKSKKKNWRRMLKLGESLIVLEA